MRVDIYCRDEAQGKHSYLAVPEGKPIPQEATNTDWHPEARTWKSTTTTTTSATTSNIRCSRSA
jgi:hypothetical protein